MTRPLRLEVAHTCYLVSARAASGQLLFPAEADYHCFVDLLARSCRRYGWQVLAYALMPASYQLLLTIGRPNLATGMRYLHSAYTSSLNRRVARRGGVFRRRYEAFVVGTGRWLEDALQRCLLAPWRAGLASGVQDWPWSSYAPSIGAGAAPPWLAVDELLRGLGSAPEAAPAVLAALLDTAGKSREPPPQPQRRCLGTPAFLSRLKAAARAAGRETSPSRPIVQPTALGLLHRREAMLAAYAEGGYTQREIATHFGVHATTVSRAVSTPSRPTSTHPGAPSHAP